MEIYLVETIHEDDCYGEELLVFSTLERAIKSANYFIQHVLIEEYSYSPVKHNEDNEDPKYLSSTHLSTEYTPGGEWLEFGCKVRIVPLTVDDCFNLIDAPLY